MSSNDLFEYWELNSADQTAILGEFKRTTSGYLISMIIFNWTNQEEREMNSFRIMPKASLKVVAPNSASQTALKEQAKQLAKTLENIFQRHLHQRKYLTLRWETPFRCVPPDHN